MSDSSESSIEKSGRSGRCGSRAEKARLTGLDEVTKTAHLVDFSMDSRQGQPRRCVGAAGATLPRKEGYSEGCDSARRGTFFRKRETSGETEESMKTTTGALAVLLATTLSLSAEQPPINHRFSEVAERLGLTSQQAGQVRAILTGMAGITKAVRKDYVLAEGNPGSQRRLARELRAIRSHADARLKRILSWTQMYELYAILEGWEDEPEGLSVTASRAR
jgi:hypothetical protein